MALGANTPARIPSRSASERPVGFWYQCGIDPFIYFECSHGKHVLFRGVTALSARAVDSMPIVLTQATRNGVDNTVEGADKWLSLSTYHTTAYVHIEEG